VRAGLEHLRGVVETLSGSGPLRALLVIVSAVFVASASVSASASASTSASARTGAADVAAELAVHVHVGGVGLALSPGRPPWALVQYLVHAATTSGSGSAAAAARTSAAHVAAERAVHVHVFGVDLALSPGGPPRALVQYLVHTATSGSGSESASGSGSAARSALETGHWAVVDHVLVVVDAPPGHRPLAALRVLVHARRGHAGQG